MDGMLADRLVEGCCLVVGAVDIGVFTAARQVQQIVVPGFLAGAPSYIEPMG